MSSKSYPSSLIPIKYNVKNLNTYQPSDGLPKLLDNLSTLLFCFQSVKLFIVQFLYDEFDKVVYFKVYIENLIVCLDWSQTFGVVELLKVENSV